MDQVDATADAGLYYMALAGALVVPDMCAALAADNGVTTKSRYMSWFDAHLSAEYEDYLSAAECYGFRCSFLHQGKSYPHKTNTRVLFIEPGNSNRFHKLRMGGNDEEAIVIDIQYFCSDITNAARKWWRASQGKEPLETNYQKFIQRYPNGITPYIVGVPVIG